MKNRKPDGCREVLKLKIAIVTGASSGMGREFALQIPQMYKNLDELWVVARRTDRLKSLQEQVKIPVRIFDGDMQRDYIFEKLQRELDRWQADVRMLVNAAGYGKIGNVSDIDLKEQCGMVDLNCTALTRMTGICLPYLSKGSRIVNLASAASFCAQPGFCVYAASKAYVLRFSQGLAAELKKRGILVTAVCPGPVRTEFFDRAGAHAVCKCLCRTGSGGDTGTYRQRAWKKRFGIWSSNERFQNPFQDPSGSPTCMGDDEDQPCGYIKAYTEYL